MILEEDRLPAFTSSAKTKGLPANRTWQGQCLQLLNYQTRWSQAPWVQSGAGWGRGCLSLRLDAARSHHRPEDGATCLAMRILHLSSLRRRRPTQTCPRHAGNATSKGGSCGKVSRLNSVTSGITSLDSNFFQLRKRIIGKIYIYIKYTANPILTSNQ